jgi:hypothetical protein
LSSDRKITPSGQFKALAQNRGLSSERLVFTQRVQCARP